MNLPTRPIISAVCLLLGAGACTKSSPEGADSDPQENAETDSEENTPASASETSDASKPKVIEAPDDVAAPPEDAEKAESGLASKVLSPGSGSDHPAATDSVTVHYTGWTTDGKMFDSSVVRGQPATFPLNRVIKGWTEGVQLMVEGEKRRFWIPAELAYGENPRAGAPAGMLVFDIELVDIVKAPEAPADVAKPPADAKKTESGLAYKVLTEGDGQTKPTENDRVSVHYSGWTTDGKMFDSSVTRGRSAQFPVTGVIKGWTEGLQLMSKGEKTRFWIPADLAYGEQAVGGRPSGMLVFDVELLDVMVAPKPTPPSDAATE